MESRTARFWVMEVVGGEKSLRWVEGAHVLNVEDGRIWVALRGEVGKSYVTVRVESLPLGVVDRERGQRQVFEEGW